MPSDSSRRHLGLAPWHRKTSQDSILSVSSSILDLLRGKPPPATPHDLSDDSQSSHRGSGSGVFSSSRNILGLTIQYSAYRLIA